jgi:hypothetical protein
MRIMDEAQISDRQQPESEANILSRIVDAMLDVQSELEDASVDQWTRTLVASCRRQKRRNGEADVALASTC